MRELVAPVQTPWATIVSCANSRVPPELVAASCDLGTGLVSFL
jgi:carbonic anhydrase